MTESANAIIADYYDAETFARIKAFADTRETPCVVIDTATIDRHYNELVEGFPYASVYCAVKADPAPQVLTILRDKGASFDIASVYELEKVMAMDLLILARDLCQAQSLPIAPDTGSTLGLARLSSQVQSKGQRKHQ